MDGFTYGYHSINIVSLISKNNRQQDAQGGFRILKKSYKIILGLLFSLFVFSVVSISAEAAQVRYFQYTVQSGETLNSLTQKFQVGSDEIISKNPALKTNSTLYAGQVLTIPDLSEIKAVQEEVVRLTNIERQKAGIAPLSSNWELSRVARYKSMDMRDDNYFSHYSPTYGDPFVMMKSFGLTFTKAGENIAARQTTASQVVQSWMNSDSHKKNILNPNFKEIGVGYAEGGYLDYYWTQMFMTR